MTALPADRLAEMRAQISAPVRHERVGGGKCSCGWNAYNVQGIMLDYLALVQAHVASYRNAPSYRPLSRKDANDLLAALDAAQAEVARLREALTALGNERNTWARQMADLRDEMATVVEERDRARELYGDAANDRDKLSVEVDDLRAALTAPPSDAEVEAALPVIRDEWWFYGGTDHSARKMIRAALTAAAAAREVRDD